MDRIQQVLQTANQIAESEEFERFMMNAQDFASQRGVEGSATTKLSQSIATLNDAAQLLNSSTTKTNENGSTVNIVSPVVIPRGHRSWGWAFITLMLLAGGILGWGAGNLGFLPDFTWVFFGPHYFAILFGYVAFHIWKNSYVMIPDGCTALITRFGKVEREVGAGRHYIFNPWVRVGYIVNTTRQYPYNAPIREAATQEQVNASVDLFLQFRIKDPRAFIFSLGGVNGFSEKLQNAISEQTRALIYSQKAEDIYDLVGESTSMLLNSLNEQFPSVEFVSTNITHAEPSSQEYRMDLAAAEMVRVAKEAYTYQYELDVRKKRDEGDLDKELAGLRETLSGIQAEVATYQAQISTAHEKEINRANAYASQLMVEAESEANANAALFQAQALDIRALRTADYPEILEYQYKQSILSRLRNVADKLPQIVQVGDKDDAQVDFMGLAEEMLGIKGNSLYTEEDLAQIRTRVDEISQRIRQRHTTISKVATVETDDIANVEEVL